MTGTPKFRKLVTQFVILRLTFDTAHLCANLMTVASVMPEKYLVSQKFKMGLINDLAPLGMVCHL